MNDQPVLLLLMISIGLYTLHLWSQDYRAHLAGHTQTQPLPGATPATTKACVIAACGAVLILAAETYGEIRLGLTAQQSKMTALFGIYTLVAAFTEELIFRGFLVLDKPNKALQWLAAIGASVLFALLHPFLWDWEDGTLSWSLTGKGVFSTATVFVSSLWFYAMRLSTLNPNRSLIPCIVAHGVKNIGVIVVKGYQGYLDGWF